MRDSSPSASVHFLVVLWQVFRHRKNARLPVELDFVRRPEAAGKPFSEGLEKVSVEFFAVDNMAKQGKADLSKIQIESIVVYVVKQKFPPPMAAQK